MDHIKKTIYKESHGMDLPFQTSLYLTTLVIYFALKKYINIPIDIVLTILAFIFFGVSLSPLYFQTDWFDKVLHIMIPLGISHIVFRMTKFPDMNFKIFSTLLGSITAISLWELFEYFIDNKFGTHLQGVYGLTKQNYVIVKMKRLDDTIADISLGVIGICIYLIIQTYLSNLSKNNKIMGIGVLSLILGLNIMTLMVTRENIFPKQVYIHNPKNKIKIAIILHHDETESELNIKKNKDRIKNYDLFDIQYYYTTDDKVNKLLEKLHDQGIRFYAGFMTSTMLMISEEFFKKYPDTYCISAGSTAIYPNKPNNVIRFQPSDEFIIPSFNRFISINDNLEWITIYEDNDKWSVGIANKLKTIKYKFKNKQEIDQIISSLDKYHNIGLVVLTIHMYQEIEDCLRKHKIKPKMILYGDSVFINPPKMNYLKDDIKYMYLSNYSPDRPHNENMYDLALFDSIVIFGEIVLQQQNIREALKMFKGNSGTINLTKNGDREGPISLVKLRLNNNWKPYFIDVHDKYTGRYYSYLNKKYK